MFRGDAKIPDLLASIVCESVKTGSDRKPESERTLLDNASNLLTNLLSGGDMGTMPIAEGAISDLFARPLFFALYDWFIQVSSSIFCD